MRLGSGEILNGGGIPDIWAAQIADTSNPSGLP